MKTHVDKPVGIQSFVFVLLLIILTGCTNTQTSRYSIKQDTAPNFDYGVITYDIIEPTRESYNIWTSKPYTIMGKHYTPMATGKGHTEVGQASWYGQKFHGHKTANGEIFDMFALTAAHKTLPLPSFVKVTNLQTSKAIIVRVNDRGPFHDDRVLDLSYGAAKKLGFHQYGVTDIKMDVIYVQENGDITVGDDPTVYISQDGELIAKPYEPKQPDILVASVEYEGQLNSPTTLAPLYDSTPNLNNSGTKSTNESGLFVQVLALQNGEKAKSLATGIANLLQVPTLTPKYEDIYKLHIGPLNSEQKAKTLIQELKKIGFDKAFTVEVLP